MAESLIPERPHAAVLRIHEAYRLGRPADAASVIALIEYAEAAEAEMVRLWAQMAAIKALTDLRAALASGG